MKTKANTRAGVLFGLTAYCLWGFFPLYFHLLRDVEPFDILCNRAIWGCVFVGMLVTLRRQWHKVGATLSQARHCLMLALAALLVGSNWLTFLYAVAQHQVVASSLGYFLTPLVNVVLGVLILKERLDVKDWLAIGLAVLALGNEIVSLGELPWLSLILALTFGFYGLVRKQVPVEAIPGLWLETLAMLPICVAYMLWRAQEGHEVLGGHTPETDALLTFAGALTALPLMAFAAAARRLNLATVGMLMYINPTLQFLIAVYAFGEPLQRQRLVSFGLIWLGLAVFSADAWQKARRKAV